MALQIRKAERSEIVRLVCPHCGERVKSVGLLRDSKVSGLTFRCKKCQEIWEVTTK